MTLAMVPYIEQGTFLDQSYNTSWKGYMCSYIHQDCGTERYTDISKIISRKQRIDG